MSQYFTDEELRCHCDKKEECDAKPMDMETVMAFDSLRRELGFAIPMTSSTRCRYWNEKVGGEEDSWHLLGLAGDLRVTDARKMARIVKIAPKHGFRGIGIRKHMVHLDRRPTDEVEMFGY